MQLVLNPITVRFSINVSNLNQVGVSSVLKFKKVRNSEIKYDIK